MNVQMRPPESDHTLLAAYAQRQCQRSFAALVERHGMMVRASALRQVRRQDLADDVTQAVFILLAQRAGRIAPNINVAAWLHKTCRYTCLNALKMERRRNQYEQRAATMTRAEVKNTGWSGLWPLLDEGIERLSEADRTAIVLRFLEQKPLSEVGSQLGVSEDAAGMRVSRALERLRAFFHRRGIGLSTANLGMVLHLQLSQTAPLELAPVGSGAPTPVSHLGANSPRTLELVRSMNRAMAWQAAQSGAIALASAAAIFILLCTVAQWWITPKSPAFDDRAIALAEGPTQPPAGWSHWSAYKLP